VPCVRERVVRAAVPERASAVCGPARVRDRAEPLVPEDARLGSRLCAERARRSNRH
jgi:hypothetical protein